MSQLCKLCDIVQARLSAARFVGACTSKRYSSTTWKETAASPGLLLQLHR